MAEYTYVMQWGASTVIRRVGVCTVVDQQQPRDIPMASFTCVMQWGAVALQVLPEFFTVTVGEFLQKVFLLCGYLPHGRLHRGRASSSMSLVISRWPA